MAERLMKEEEVAEACGVGRRRLRTLVKQGLVPEHDFYVVYGKTIKRFWREMPKVGEKKT